MVKQYLAQQKTQSNFLMNKLGFSKKAKKEFMASYPNEKDAVAALDAIVATNRNLQAREYQVNSW